MDNILVNKWLNKFIKYDHTYERVLAIKNHVDGMYLITKMLLHLVKKKKMRGITGEEELLGI